LLFDGLDNARVALGNDSGKFERCKESRSIFDSQLIVGVGREKVFMRDFETSGAEIGYSPLLVWCGSDSYTLTIYRKIKGELDGLIEPNLGAVFEGDRGE